MQHFCDLTTRTVFGSRRSVRVVGRFLYRWTGQLYFVSRRTVSNKIFPRLRRSLRRRQRSTQDPPGVSRAPSSDAESISKVSTSRHDNSLLNLLLSFHTFSVLVANPKKTTHLISLAHPGCCCRSWSGEQGNSTQEPPGTSSESNDDGIKSKGGDIR